MRIVIDTQKYDDVTLGQIKDAVCTAPHKLFKRLNLIRKQPVEQTCRDNCPLEDCDYDADRESCSVLA